MGNRACTIYEYGYYGYNVFEVPMQATNVKMLPKMDIDSTMTTTFNMASKSALVDINVNTGEYYEAQSNEGDYANLIDFVKTNQIGRIPQISSNVKILVDYTITTMDGATVDGGVRISEVPMVDCVTLMPVMDEIYAPYRLAKYITTAFTIERFNTNGGVTFRGSRPMMWQGMPFDQLTGKFILYINSIRVLGTPADDSRQLPKSMNGGSYTVNSQTLADIERDSVELFSTIWYDLSFNSQEIPGYVTSINMPIEIVTPMIVTTNARDIDRLLAINSEKYYPGDVPGEIVVDMFKPLIQRPHCPGTLPHDYFKYWEPRKHNPVSGSHHGEGPTTNPVKPGHDWPYHGGPLKIDVNRIDKNTPPGVYTNSGIMKYTWKELLTSGAIEVTHKGDATFIGTPDTKIRGAKITPSDIGPILVIPGPHITQVMVIAESAFFGYDNLEIVYLPKEVRRIDRHAFYGCCQLEAVYIAANGLEGLNEIGDNAFMNCMKLKHVSTSIALAIIGERAFFHCSLLKLVVPPSVGVIGENAFHEMFQVKCSPKTDLSKSGIDPKDVEFFSKGDIYYNPDDYIEEEPNGDGNEESGGESDGTGSSDGGDIGTTEPEPDDSEGTHNESDLTGSTDIGDSGGENSGHEDSGDELPGGSDGNGSESTGEGPDEGGDTPEETPEEGNDEEKTSVENQGEGSESENGDEGTSEPTDTEE